MSGGLPSEGENAREAFPSGGEMQGYLHPREGGRFSGGRISYYTLNTKCPSIRDQ